MDMSVRFPGLGISLDYVGKSVRILGFEITIYGMLIAAGMLIGFSVLVMEAKRSNENQNFYLLAAIAGVIGGTIGGRLVYVLFSWPLYQDHMMEIFHISGGGMSVYGVLGGGILGIALFCRIQKQSFSQAADIASIGFLAGQIIGRWGDFFNRESFGEYTNSALAMQLPLSAVRSGEVTALMREHLEDVNGISCIQVHPLFLYESCWCLLLLIYLLGCKRKKKFQGEIFMRYLAGYGLGRFFIEWLRTDSLLIPGTRIAAGQVICAALVVIAGSGAFISRSMVKKREALRRRKREAIYEEEEKAEAELDAREKENLSETPDDVEKEILSAGVRPGDGEKGIQSAGVRPGDGEKGIQSGAAKPGGGERGIQSGVTNPGDMEKEILSDGANPDHGEERTIPAAAKTDIPKEKSPENQPEKEDTLGRKKESYTSLFTGEEAPQAMPVAPVLPRSYFETEAGEEDHGPAGSGEKPEAEPETGQTAGNPSAGSES